MAAAREAFETGQFTTPAERSTMLYKFADAVAEHADELARIESANVGKPMSVFVPFIWS